MIIKDKLIRKVAADLELEEDLVHKIVTFQGEDAFKQARLVQQIEFSGFGKFLLSQTKVKKRIARMEKAVENYKNMEHPNIAKIEFCEKTIEELKNLLR